MQQEPNSVTDDLSRELKSRESQKLDQMMELLTHTIIDEEKDNKDSICNETFNKSLKLVNQNLLGLEAAKMKDPPKRAADSSRRMIVSKMNISGELVTRQGNVSLSN